MMINIRVFFKKCGRLKYISHLDVVRLMNRVIKKAGIPVWYTEGFNPHMYLTFALPLSLGYESEYEIMDFRITEQISLEEIKSKLNSALPEDIEVTNVCEPYKKITDISSAQYDVELISNNISPEILQDKLNGFLSQEQINVEKKTKKKGVRTIDIKPDINAFSFSQTDNGIVFKLVLPAGERTINPSLMLDEFNRYSDNAVFLSRVKRTMVYDTQQNSFK